MKEEEAVQIFNLVRAKGMLPAKLEELVPLTFIGQAAVSFYRSRIKLMDQLKMTEEQRRATLRDGQDAGEMLLDIEARVGELLPDPARIPKKDTGNKFEKELPEGLNFRRAYDARSISKNPEIVEKVKKQARENEDIPTRTAVMNQINYEKEKKSNALIKENMAKIKAHVAIEQVQYLGKLDRVISILPIKPPENWDDRAFEMAKVKANIIIKRLEVFNG